MMNISDMNWFQVESYLEHDDRAMISLGSTEQHAYLSLCVDHILSSKLAEESGSRAQVPVFPGVPFGIAPYFSAFPGTVTIRPTTYFQFVCDLLDSLYRQGFRRIMIINGHGGNSPVQAQIQHWLMAHQDAKVIFHNWWASTTVQNMVQSISSNASHASWMENFPWTRLQGVVMPDAEKPMIDLQKMAQLSPAAAKAMIGDGNYGGRYSMSDDVMLAIWQAAVEEATHLVEHGWAVSDDC
ncbi:creatininase family protein [Photobacterium sp. GJ3]|uniref:creatininase family protein n=1 Tax=Photobacterium sp. GJ3 TaxID=2829502 RepID=UPI001B8B47DB|nr:creatininase family protein [Photobacterium sp. GJ3]QUJ67966.1 creatininase family protein [Photobacterium sp. GJ3]